MRRALREATVPKEAKKLRKKPLAKKESKASGSKKRKKL